VFEVSRCKAGSLHLHDLNMDPVHVDLHNLLAKLVIALLFSGKTRRIMMMMLTLRLPSSVYVLVQFSRQQANILPCPHR
jgi:hypothetical protein